jgi:hypothetical protein
MKTIEEMKEAVLAYCEEACPKGTKEAIIANGVTLEWIDYGDVMTGGLRLYGVADWMYIEADMDEYVTLHAYRLLGLETRDALAPYKSENERLQSAWMTEKARNAALVEALEVVKYGCEFGNQSLGCQKLPDSKGYSAVIGSPYEFVCNALSANTEKGGAKWLR